MKYPNRLNTLRDARGISLDRLAALLSTSKSAVQKYNNGSVELGAGRLMQIAEVLMVQPEELIADHPSRIVNRIAEAREALGLSQEELADRLHWPLWQVRTIELATRFPPGDLAFQISDALGVAPTDVLFDLTQASEEAKAMAGLVDGLEEPDRHALYRHADALAKSHPKFGRKQGNGG